ncbi:neuralized-like protein 4 [Glandiceps talaboti]
MGKRGNALVHERGVPPTKYVEPNGWARLALKVSDYKVKDEYVGDLWHVAYHGTRISNVAKILENGIFLIPGDVALGGKELGVQPNHFGGDIPAPTDFDTKQIFVSPSIKYAGCEVYACSNRWADQTTLKIYNARVAFQVWIRPESYTVSPQTIGATAPIDRKFNNDELEWSTKERTGVILYGLLVKLEEINPVVRESRCSIQ